MKNICFQQPNSITLPLGVLRGHTKTSKYAISHPNTIMAAIDPMIHLDAFHGKYGRTDRVYARVRKFDNKTLGIALKNPVTNMPPTENQQVVQDKFKAVQVKVAAALADPAQRAKYMTEWKAQHKYKTLRGYVFAKLYNAETA